MIRYFLKVFSNHFRQGRTLFLLSVFGVALGVASVLSIQIINHNAIGAFSAGIEAVSGEADLSVLSSTHTFSENLYPEVLSLAGVSAAWPLYRIDVSLADRKNFFLEIIGVDFLTTTLLPLERLGGGFLEGSFPPLGGGQSLPGSRDGLVSWRLNYGEQRKPKSRSDNWCTGRLPENKPLGQPQASL